MKKFLALFTITMFAFAFINAPQASAQMQDQKITVRQSDLTVDQIAKIKLEQANEELQKKLDTYGKWVGVGGEIGNAVKEGLNAVVDVSDKFSKTDVGKFTMLMIAWKVIGRDVLRIIIGFVFFICFTVFMFQHYKKNFTVHRICTESNGWKFWLPKKYELVTPSDYDGYEFTKCLNIVMYIGGCAITYAIMFG